MPGIHRYQLDIYELLAENYALRHEVSDLKAERRNLRNSKSALKKDVEKLADRASQMNETNVGLQDKLNDLEAALERLKERASATAGRRSHSDRGAAYEANERRPVNDNRSTQRRVSGDRSHGPGTSASVSRPSAISVPGAGGASLGRTQGPSHNVGTRPQKRRNKTTENDDDEYEFVPDDAEVAIEDERYEYMELPISRTELGNIDQPSEEPIRMEDYHDRFTPTQSTSSLPATCTRQQPAPALPVHPHQPAPPKLRSPAMHNITCISSPPGLTGSNYSSLLATLTFDFPSFADDTHDTASPRPSVYDGLQRLSP
ncbi:hypothetical protein EXIGLDRAFT_836330 [Exidia glandulosa HHB12029]|uniref:Uncharacterized protein n=1 Tax=Exidia glandulosa HHB12029 TaxID=1314781 RepID=A0A165HYH1_EXIGL|nr:hypothetical protein EXIGLDRAFT_836330 [Exidia glandulosa HHB12029]